MMFKTLWRNWKLIIVGAAATIAITFLSHKAKYQCINEVNAVADMFLKKSSINLKCAKIQSKSFDQCNNYQAESKLNASDVHIENQLKH